MNVNNLQQVEMIDQTDILSFNYLAPPTTSHIITCGVPASHTSNTNRSRLQGWTSPPLPAPTEYHDHFDIEEVLAFNRYQENVDPKLLNPAPALQIVSATQDMSNTQGLTFDTFTEIQSDRYASALHHPSSNISSRQPAPATINPSNLQLCNLHTAVIDPSILQQTTCSQTTSNIGQQRNGRKRRAEDATTPTQVQRIDSSDGSSSSPVPTTRPVKMRRLLIPSPVEFADGVPNGPITLEAAQAMPYSFSREVTVEGEAHGPEFNNLTRITRACARCRLFGTVTSLIKNNGRRTLAGVADSDKEDPSAKTDPVSEDTVIAVPPAVKDSVAGSDSDVEDSRSNPTPEEVTEQFKRDKEQDFRYLFANGKDFAMNHLQEQLDPGQFHRLEHYFGRHGFRMDFVWCK
ncbi:hypothetical protein QFC20_002578 [Naganishia adeliensis]|uniref:Uncharacterized protein n=1 Tax=Naganishia adeliensis TaxID=92952 RepID=A0ACC2WL63_9TREE|nr:hypothetical protein QFC20_002578 [Naganishia adeliensis]